MSVLPVAICLQEGSGSSSFTIAMVFGLHYMFSFNFIGYLIHIYWFSDGEISTIVHDMLEFARCLLFLLTFLFNKIYRHIILDSSTTLRIIWTSISIKHAWYWLFLSLLNKYFLVLVSFPCFCSFFFSIKYTHYLRFLCYVQTDTAQHEVKALTLWFLFMNIVIFLVKWY